MAGKRKLFEQALREANNFAWDGQWDRAIEAYRRALEEFPADAAVRASLAQAYVSAGKLEGALPEFERLSALTPDDPTPVLRLADTLARLGRTEEAAGRFEKAAGLLESAGQPARAAEALEYVVKLLPQRVAAREQLLALYQTLGKQNAALEQLLALARLHQTEGQQERAMGYLQQALQINPRSAEARQILEGLRSGIVSVVRGTAAPPAPERPAEARRAAGSNPADAARQRALAALAEQVFERSEEPPPDPSEPAAIAQKRAEERSRRAKIDALIGQAIDLHTRGLTDDAIAQYTKALELGADQPAIHLNLGLLQQEKRLDAAAIEHLKAALAAPEYTLGAHFALGEIYRRQNKIDLALKHFIEALKLLDVQSAQREQADDLIQLYETLAESYLAEGAREKALVFMASLVDFLSRAGWQERVARARERLNALNQAGFTASLVEILEAPDSDAILESMGLIQEYLRRKMLLTAGEECYRAISLAPGYLPLHLRLAEILMAQDRFDEAIAKYMAVAETYLARGQMRQAIGVYRQVLSLAPMDVAVRRKLIELLTASNQIDQALEDYLALADAYYRMAQVEEAIEAYNQALRLAPRAPAREAAEARVLHGLGDIYLQSLDWLKARKAYQRIIALQPADLEARQRLMELSFRLGERNAGLAQLDELIAQHRAQGAVAALTTLLSELTQAHPQDIEIQRRAAAAYQALNLRAEAIAALNALGELQLDAGQYADAAETVRRLIVLEPDKADDYRLLLQQILSQAGSGGGVG